MSQTSQVKAICKLNKETLPYWKEEEKKPIETLKSRLSFELFL